MGHCIWGEISGLNTAITVFASAIGPVSFSLANDSFGLIPSRGDSLRDWGWRVLLLISVFTPQPNDRLPRGAWHLVRLTYNIARL